MLDCIWAQAKNGIIGNHGKIPWNEPADMHYFVRRTMHRTIVFGKNTYKTFPPKGLPHRNNIVISKSLYNIKDTLPSTIHVINSIDSLLQYAKNHHSQDIIICGGTSVYKQLLPYTDKLYQTIICHNFAGDKKAVPIDYSKFKLVKQSKHPANKKNPYPYIFRTYRRK